MSDTPPSFTVETADKDKPTAKRPPGRPKGTTNAARSAATSSNDVKQAMASLDMMYDIISTGLLMWNRPLSASVWASKSATLRETNENALKASPKLARFLAGVGSTSGAITFITAHTVAFGALAMTLQLEAATNKEDSATDGTTAPHMG
jgi:hypothetical protein